MKRENLPTRFKLNFYGNEIIMKAKVGYTVLLSSPSKNVGTFQKKRKNLMYSNEQIFIYTDKFTS